MNILKLSALIMFVCIQLTIFNPSVFYLRLTLSSAVLFSFIAVYTTIMNDIKETNELKKRIGHESDIDKLKN